MKAFFLINQKIAIILGFLKKGLHQTIINNNNNNNRETELKTTNANKLSNIESIDKNVPIYLFLLLI